MNTYQKMAIVLFAMTGLSLSSVCAGGENNFYGQVIDNDKTPVDGAYVTARVKADDSDAAPEKVIVQTDPQGRFEIHSTGDILEILSIRKNGYFFFKDKKNQYTFYYQATDGHPPHVADEKAPVVFHIDREAKPAKIQTYRTFRFQSDKAAVYTIDLSSEGVPRLKRDKVPDEILKIPEVRQIMHAKTRKMDLADDYDIISEPNSIDDIQITAHFTDDSNSILLIESLLPGTGLVMTKKMNEKAPKEGYQPQLKIQVPIQEVSSPIEKYLYVRARNGEIISQIHLTLTGAPEQLLAKAAIKSNLDGSNNFKTTGFYSVPDAKDWDSQQQRMQKACEKHQQRK